MRFNEIINESLSPIAYHYTGIFQAHNILATGKFELSSVYGAHSEQNMQINNYPYFLSTTRTRQGGYHSMIGHTAVMFVLDGSWFNSRYPSRAVDYWNNRAKPDNRRHEAEDRVFSKNSNIPIDGVIAVHVYADTVPNEKYLGKMTSNIKSEVTDYQKSIVRKILLLAKKNDIPAYFYTDKEAWRQFDKRKLGDISTLKSDEEVKVHVPYLRADFKGFLYPWVQLIKAKRPEQITDEKAKRLLSHLKRDAFFYVSDMVRSLSSDMFNARRGSVMDMDRKHMISIVKFMQKHNIREIYDLVQFLVDKYKITR